MKKLFFLLAGFLILTGLNAQTDSLLEKIRAHNRRMDSLQQKLAEYLENGTREILPLPEEKRTIKLAVLLDDYENRRDYYFMREMDRLRAETGTDSLVEESWRVKIINVVKKAPSPGKTVTKKEEKHHPAKKRRKTTESMLRLRFGWNNFSQNSRQEYDYWKSRYVGLQYLQAFYLDKASKWAVYAGAGIACNNLAPADNHVIHTVADNKLTWIKQEHTLDKSVLKTLWIRVPAGLHYNINKQWSIGIEAYAKFYANSKQKIKYRDGKEKIFIKEKDYFRQNRFVWGAGGYLAFDDFRLTFGMDFVPYFKDYEMPLISIGFSL